MIRFVDLTKFYWAEDDGAPCCAFVNTVNDRFIEVDGSHVIDELAEIEAMDPYLRDRCLALLPEGFFDRVPNPD